MAERLSEIELEEIQELKEHAENKNTKKKAQQPVLERKARSLRQQGDQTQLKLSLRSHLALLKKNFSASHYKHITTRFRLGIWYKYRS